MPGGMGGLVATADVNRVEAPITFKAYVMCAFASVGGLFFGYDSGYISGVLGMAKVINLLENKPYLPNNPTQAQKDNFVLADWRKSLIVSILSAGTFFGAIFAGDLADWFGRRTTILLGCLIFTLGVILQTAAHGLGLLVAGRLIAGVGVGFVSAIIILYMSEIAPRKVRGMIVSGYQFCITIGLVIAASVDYGTQNRRDTGSYRIPIALQLIWALVLAIGLFLLPESPRYFVKKGNLERAAQVLARVRGQPADSEYIQQELAEIVANQEYERSVIPDRGYLGTWLNCFTGGIRNPSSNLRKTVLGITLQMMQQWTGVNFIFYFGTTFFQELGTIKNAFLTQIICNIVNMAVTPISFWLVEKVGRRPMLIWGAVGMFVCEFLAAIIGVTAGKPSHHNNSATSAMIALICLYIVFFATTWGPGAWVIIGEIFPLPIRSRGVALSTASNWFWNCIITIITPYLVGIGHANLGAKVFFIWGSTCVLCWIYAYFLIPETKGLSLEQVDRMLEETTPRTSSKWVPHSTFAADMGLTEKGTLAPEIVRHTENLDSKHGQGGYGEKEMGHSTV